MNDHDLLALLQETHDELGRILHLCTTADERDGLTLLQRLEQSRNGWPRSSGFEAGRGKQQRDPDDPDPSALLHSDPTGEAAIRTDRANDAHNRIVRRAKHLRATVEGIATEAGAYELRNANWIERQDTENQDEPGCDSCARVDSPGTVGKAKALRTPWYNRVDLTTTLANGASVKLCDWCWRGPVGVKHSGELPPIADVEKHRDGVRVRKTA